jgi:hypothetical protein
LIDCGALPSIATASAFRKKFFPLRDKTAEGASGHPIAREIPRGSLDRKICRETFVTVAIDGAKRMSRTPQADPA